ncbi:hypothetical protein HU200_035940 [Digitaria exilis]|uniref:Uncharacterized protein n=1 Tax=Digitaria exilis TaxID=1010633 RepID=A0A835BFI5_9POAL|nr:hypothetical protein HU200_035940 [Digitaria exilis]
MVKESREQGGVGDFRGDETPSLDSLPSRLRASSLFPLFIVLTHFIEHPVGTKSVFIEFDLSALPHNLELRVVRVAAVLDKATMGDLLGVALNGAGERVRNTDTIRPACRVIVGDRRAEPACHQLADAGTMEKVLRTVDEMATEDSRAMSMFVGRGHRQRGEQGVEGVALLPTHSALDAIEREKECSNKRLTLQAVFRARTPPQPATAMSCSCLGHAYKREAGEPFRRHHHHPNPQHTTKATYPLSKDNGKTHRSCRPSLGDPAYVCCAWRSSKRRPACDSISYRYLATAGEDILPDEPRFEHGRAQRQSCPPTG